MPLTTGGKSPLMLPTFEPIVLVLALHHSPHLAVGDHFTGSHSAGGETSFKPEQGFKARRLHHFFFPCPENDRTNVEKDENHEIIYPIYMY